MKTKRVLAIGAHPDDVEIFCGGTLAKFAKQGVKVTFMTVTNGDKGSFEKSVDEIIKMRKQECISAGKIINANWIGLGFSDAKLIWNEKLHIKMIQAIQQVNPDLIITHPPKDYHSDHEEVSKTVTKASFFVTCPQFVKNAKVADKVPPVYFMDSMCGVDFIPDEYVDITNEIDEKIAMYAEHKSQHKYLGEREGIDFFDMIKTTAHYRGLQCGVQYAEGFKQFKEWGRLSTERLLP